MNAVDPSVVGQAPRGGDSVFARIVVGVDGTAAGEEACRQALRLADAAGTIEAACAVYVGQAALAGLSAPRLAEELEQEGREALERARAILGDRGETRLIEGMTVTSLTHELERVRATLVAIGSHGHRRATEILIGGAAGELLHGAPCSVLVARPAREPAAFPRSIVVGLDGSAHADLALAAAEELGRRFRAALRVVVALDGKEVDLVHVHERARAAEELPGRPVAVLVEAAEAADLVVVGSRGLHGLRALGSVSERVAHQARSSVLVVRRATARSGRGGSRSG